MTRPTRKRSLGQLAVAVFFGFLAAAFLLRTLFYGYKWITHAGEGSANFKAMTIWTLLYTAVCAAIAFVSYRKPPDDDVIESDGA